MNLNTAETSTAQPVDYSSIKNKQRAVWSSGDYAVLGSLLQIIGENLVEAVGVRANDRVLDVAAGNGNATLAAARRHAQVVSTDYVQELLDKGARRAEANGLDVQFQVADAEALPFETGSFDVVLSTVGVMFAPNQKSAASEMIRVTRQGGRIGLANWTPEGFIGELFRTIGRYVPPPADISSPMLWGSEPHIVDLLGSQAEEIHTTRRNYNFCFRSAAHWLDVFREYYGPMNRAYASLDMDAQNQLTNEIMDLLERHNIAGKDTLLIPAEYLEVVIRRI